MEQHKLYFDRPVLSVRRFGPTSAEVENKARTHTAQHTYPSIPFYKADLKSAPIRNPGTVPFVWEKTPGRPKHETKSLYQNSQPTPIAPRLPPGRKRDLNEKLETIRSPDYPITDLPQAKNVMSPHWSTKQLVATMEKLGNYREGCEESEGFSSEDDDDAFVDARDTLSVSRSESFFENCSLTGLSGMDGSDAILTGTASADPRAVDFMLGRFLPAAKAMVSETPAHLSKRMNVVREQPKQATVRLPTSISTSDPNFLRHYIQNEIEEDSEDEMDDDDQINITSKGCGLLPRFCLLIPVQGLRTMHQTKAKSVRTLPTNCFRNGHETNSSTMTNSAANCGTAEIQEDLSGSSIKCASAQNESSECSSHVSQKFTGISIESKQAQNFASGPKPFKTFQDFLLDQNDEHEFSPESRPMVATPISSLPAKDMPKMITENCDQFHDKINILSDVPSRESSAQATMHLTTVDENKALRTEIMSPFNSVETQAVKIHQDSQVVRDKFPAKGELSEKGFPISEYIKEEEHKDHINHQIHLVVSRKIPVGRSYPQLPKPPPLPNTPSDSWLCRALPFVSSKNQSYCSYHGSVPMQIHSKQNAPKKHNADPKWEMMVKTSKPQRGHHRYSEEMLAPIPEASNISG